MFSSKGSIDNRSGGVADRVVPAMASSGSSSSISIDGNVMAGVVFGGRGGVCVDGMERDLYVQVYVRHQCV